MIKLGDVINVEYGSISKMWLVKDLDLKRKLEEVGDKSNGYYKVLGLQKGSGWWSLSSGVLKDMRAYIEQYQIKGA